MADQWNGTITGWVNTSLLTVGSPNSLGVLIIAPENNTLTKYTLEGNGAFQGFNFTNTQKADGKEDFWYKSNQTGKIIIGNLTSGTSYGAVDTLTLLWRIVLVTQIWMPCPLEAVRTFGLKK